MCNFIGKSNERILCKLSKSDILRLYSIVHVALETTKTSHFTCQSKSFISIFFTCQVSACEQQPFSCHDLANGIHTETDKTVFGHLKRGRLWKRHLKSEFAQLPTFSRLFHLVQFVKFWQIFVWSWILNDYRISGKEKESRCLVFTSSTKCKTTHFYVVVPRQKKNVQKCAKKPDAPQW